jgi:hypothetical protein
MRLRFRALAGAGSLRAACGSGRLLAMGVGLPVAALLVAVALLGPVPLAEAQDHDGARGLAGLKRVALDIAFSPIHSGVPVEDVQQRMEEVLRNGLPQAPVVDAKSPDRLRLVVSVWEISTTDLRGFWLPFSRSHGIGVVRLGVERPVTIAGSTTPVRAIVWQSEAQARAPWRDSATEILQIAEDLTEAFLADYRRLRGQ